jgi:hypothetical protein
MKLGEILVKQKLLTEAQLTEALTHQHARGARLGTYLIEQGTLTADQVALALAEQFSVPPALEADFLHADSSLRKRMVVHQAIELQAIPLFRTHPRRVAVAMANPSNPRALDRLAFILGATVEPMVASETSINRQFELLYNVKRRKAPRNALLGLGDGPVRRQGGVSSVTPDEYEIRPALRSHHRRAKALRLAPLEPGKSTPEPAAPITPMEDALCFTPTPLSAQLPVRIPTPPLPTRALSRHPLTPILMPITNAGAQLVVEQIRFATDKQDLSDSLFIFMRACFGVGGMFAVTGAMAQGLFGFANGRVCPEIEHLCFSLSLPSCFRIARSRRATFRGLPPPDGGAVHGPLWSALGGTHPIDALVSPVIVDGQVTLLLYAHGECGGHMNDLAASKMEQVCEALSSSLLRLAV